MLINNLQIFDDNYISTWKILMEEYDDKRALIHKFIYKYIII